MTLQRYDLKVELAGSYMVKREDGGWVDADEAQEEIDCLRHELSRLKNPSPPEQTNLHHEADEQIEALRCNHTLVRLAYKTSLGDEILALKMATIYLAHSQERLKTQAMNPLQPVPPNPPPQHSQPCIDEDGKYRLFE